MALTVANIRTYMKDNAELNILLVGELQSSEDLITLAMNLAVDDYNIISPQTSYVIAGFPSDSVLLFGTLYHLCNSEAEKQLRNQVMYSAQGVNAGFDDKMPQYNQLSSYYYNLFSEKATKLKIYLNTADAWGEVYSPYIGINDLNFRS